MATSDLQTTSDLFEAMSTQRAIRYWKADPVPRELLWKLAEMATRAPSGSNRQPWRFLFVTDSTKRARIGDLVREKYEANDAMKRYVATAATQSDHGTRLMLESAGSLAVDMGRAPVLVIPVLFGVDPNSARGLIAGSSIYPAAQNLLLAARGLGLAGVMTTFQAMIAADLRELLAIPDDAYPVALIPLGHPDRKFGPVRRKPVEEVTFFETWGETASR